LGTTSNAHRAGAYVVLVLLIVAGAAFLLNSRAGGVQVYDVYPTDSMLPTLEVGDLVIVQSVSYSSIHVGDIIVFAKPLSGGGCDTEVIVHRVVNITSSGLITWGDNRITNTRPDEPLSWPPVPSDCVKGVVVLSVPYLGRISEAFPPPTNYILLAIIIAIIFLIEFRGGKDRGTEETGR
jgi:signal peptidase I